MKRKNKFNPNLPRSMSKAKKALDEVHIENSAPGNALRSALAIFFFLKSLSFPTSGMVPEICCGGYRCSNYSAWLPDT